MPAGQTPAADGADAALANFAKCFPRSTSITFSVLVLNSQQLFSIWERNSSVSDQTD